SNLTKDKTSLSPGDSLIVGAMITNTGNVAGDEVPQFYIHHLFSAIKRPIKELKDFHRISLQPGESKLVRFGLAYEDLSFYNESSRTFDVATGTVEIMVGSSSEDIRLNDQVQVQGGTVSVTYSLDPMSRIEAENFDKKTKPMTLVANDSTGQSMTINAENDYLEYKNVDFGSGVNHFETRIWLDSMADGNGFLGIKLDSLTGPVIGYITLDASKKKQAYQLLSCSINGAIGKHDLFLVFPVSENGYCRIDWFNFYFNAALQDSNRFDIRLFPNPASSSFQLVCNCPSAAEINIEIFTLEGLKINSINKKIPHNEMNFLVNVDDIGLKQGMYLIKCRVNGYSRTLKLFVVK
ncbi:MAG: fibronectin type III-like domain-contianing protein, partial [Bacteroidota bacterium]